MTGTPTITLVLGGARSGKSEVAEALAARGGAPVTYIATASVENDPAWNERVALHRDRRPASWATLEAGEGLLGALGACQGTVLVESLGTWIAAYEGFDADVEGLTRTLSARQGRSIVVSEEVGLGVHPSTQVGGLFRDALGKANRAVAAISDEVLLVVAGRVLRLERFEPTVEP
jgi:adenosylcobinamide kinase / adenosylcobinamide-phosphate guanylyltransferase